MAKQEKYVELADKVLDCVGGKGNVAYFTHCVTRLRFNVKDRGCVKMEEVKKLPGVMGAQWSGDQLQLIIGQSVAEAYNVICERNQMEKAKAVEENLDQKKEKQNPVLALLGVISGSVIPVVPVLMGVGMIKVFYTLAVQFGILSTESPTYMILNLVNGAAFYFLPIYVGANAAKKFGANMGIGMLLGGMLIHPTFVTAVSEGTALSIFGIPIYGTGYGSSIFPVIISVYVMSKVEKFISKHSPDFLRAILVPMLTIFVMIPLTFCVLGPIGAFLGTYLAKAVEFVFSHLGFLAYAIFGVIFPIMVMFGMHTALGPISVQSMATLEYEPLSIASFVSTCTLTACCLAVALRTRNKDMKSTASTSAITAFVGGITEPAMYGVALRLKKPFFCALIGNFVAGIVSGLFQVKCYTQGPSNILSIAKWIAPEGGMNFPAALLAAAVGFAVTFGLIYFGLYRKSDPMEGEE